MSPNKPIPHPNLGPAYPHRSYKKKTKQQDLPLKKDAPGLPSNTWPKKRGSRKQEAPTHTSQYVHHCQRANQSKQKHRPTVILTYNAKTKKPIRQSFEAIERASAKLTKELPKTQVGAPDLYRANVTRTKKPSLHPPVAIPYFLSCASGV